MSVDNIDGFQMTDWPRFAELAVLPFGAVVTDETGRVAFCNDAAGELLGEKPPVGRYLRAEFWKLRRFEAGSSEMPHETVLATRISVTGEMCLIERADGTVKQVLWRSAFVPADGGSNGGTVNLIVDISDDRNLELDAARLSAIAASTDDAIISKTLDGVITSWNSAATRIFGYNPEEMIGQPILKLIPEYLEHEEKDIIQNIRAGRRVPPFDTVRLRKDGSLVDLSVTVSPVRDRHGKIVGASKIARDVTCQKEAAEKLAWLAAIVESSDDAIISKNLNGVITSWNRGAQKVFGYTEAEMVGQSVRKLIPSELQDQEDEILAKISRGERIEHFDTERLTKAGRRIDVSLTISPIVSPDGKVIGASKIARDISERKAHEELQRLLFNELNHRVKNMLATIQAVARQTLRTARGTKEFVTSFSGRLSALASAHDLLVRGKMVEAGLKDIISEQVSLGSDADSRIQISGPVITLDGRAAVQVALLLHELATNARKYGALSRRDGRLRIEWHVSRHPVDTLVLEWLETGGSAISPPERKGFGSILIEKGLQSLGGEASVTYADEGLRCRIWLPLPKEDSTISAKLRDVARKPTDHPGGLLDICNRILVVEDDALIAMDLAEALRERGWVVVGPASKHDEALRLIDEEAIDAALLDATLGGRNVEEIARALSVKGVPFVFASGYGRDGLPEAYRDILLLAKPYTTEAIISAVKDMLVKSDKGSSKGFE
ncbi:PAS domain S-box protein [Roseivivax sp. CAU 1761]